MKQMNIKSIIKKVPYKNRVFWLCLGFAIIYMALGWRMADTLVYDYDGLLFNANTARVAEDLTAFYTEAHSDTTMHPFFTLLLNPLGSFLNIFLPVTASVILINTALGTLMIWVAYHCFRLLGLPRHQSTLWTILTGCTASNLLIASIPERHLAASLSITLMCFFCIKYPGRVGKFVWIGLLTFGITITNFAQCLIMFFASLFNRDNKKEHLLRFALKKTLQFGIITLIIAVGLSLIQKQIWPNADYFFLPESHIEEAMSSGIQTNPELSLYRFFNLSAHMFVFNIVAPTTFIDLGDKIAPLSLSLKSMGSFRHIGWISISGWTLLLFLGFHLVFFRKHNKWFWLQMGIHGCLLFNVVVHMLYGDAFFLSSANWTFLILIMVSSTTVAANKSRGFRITVDTLLTLMIMAVILNNALFIDDVSSYFRYGSSMKWQMNHGEQWEKAKLMERFLLKNQIHTLFADNDQKWFAYAANQSIKVVNISDENSPSLKKDAELMSENYAFLDDIGNVVAFLTNSLGSYTMTSIDDADFYHSIRRPHLPLAPARRKNISSIRASHKSRDAYAVSDLNMDTQWVGENTSGKDNWIEFSFAERQQVACVKLFSKDGNYPNNWQIDIRETPTSNWSTVTSEMSSGGYFWSGPRIFWSGKQFHPEARFLPILTSQIRLTFSSNSKNTPPALSEVRIYGPGDPFPSEMTALPLLMEELREKKIKRLYSERWAANAVYKETTALRGKRRMNIETLLEPYVFQHERSRKQPTPERTPYPVCLSKHTAILVRNENADSTRACLNERGYKMRETTIGPWILFDFRGSEWNNTYAGDSKLYWSGISCFLAEFEKQEVTSCPSQDKDQIDNEKAEGNRK